MNTTNFTELKPFLSIVKKLESTHGVKVTVQNDNNTVVGIHNGKTVAQWFGPSGFILTDYIDLANKPVIAPDRVKRDEVYAAIDTERAYQDDKWGEAVDPRPLSIGEDILLIEEYVLKARQAWSTEHRPEVGALEQIRKIAGIAVRCMENHGAPKRKL